MPQKKLQVFISSTFIDMKDERQAAVEAVLQAGHIPAGMELFASGDESQLQTIRRWIDDSDVFMLILGGRYGSIEPKSCKSYVQLEYEYAVEKGKPVFAAIMSEECLGAKVKAIGADALEQRHGPSLEQFRNTVKQRICRFFEDMKDIKIVVFQSLTQFVEKESIVGWVRADEVIDAKETLEELTRLREQNAGLSEQLQELRQGSAGGMDQTSSVVGSLSEQAKALLVAAAKGDGHFLYLKYMGGSTVGAHGMEALFSGNNPREEARWSAAIDQLLDLGLAEDRGYKHEVFRLTNRGYELAEVLAK